MTARVKTMIDIGHRVDPDLKMRAEWYAEHRAHDPETLAALEVGFVAGWLGEPVPAAGPGVDHAKVFRAHTDGADRRQGWNAAAARFATRINKRAIAQQVTR